MATLKSDKYREIGEAVREKLFPKLQGCRIAWLASTKAKKTKNKIIFAQCQKFDKEKLTWLSEQEYDFMITVYEPNCQEYYFDDRKYAILLEHELMHVGYDPETGDCTIIPHDAEEFKRIISKYGIDWAERFDEETDGAPNDAPEDAPEEEPAAEPEDTTT